MIISPGLVECKKTDLTLKEELRSGHVSASKNKLYNTLVYHDHSITN